MLKGWQTLNEWFSQSKYYYLTPRKYLNRSVCLRQGL
jgi:hypothetical protein